MTGGGDDPRAVFDGEPLLGALNATRKDGAERHVLLNDSPDRQIEATVWRDADGRLTVALLDSALDAGEPLRSLARRMAGENDTEVLLELLCDTGAEQCGGTGAAVLRAASNEGELVAAIGPLAMARGRRFALPGSLAREVLRKRDVVSVADFSGSALPLMKVVPDLTVGPMLRGWGESIGLPVASESALAAGLLRERGS